MLDACWTHTPNGRKSDFSLRSRRKHNAWGVSPRSVVFKSEPAERAKYQRILRLPPVSRADETGRIFPGADAPGFRLTPALQAKREIGGAWNHNT